MTENHVSAYLKSLPLPNTVHSGPQNSMINQLKQGPPGATGV